MHNLCSVASVRCRSASLTDPYTFALCTLFNAGSRVAASAGFSPSSSHFGRGQARTGGTSPAARCSSVQEQRPVPARASTAAGESISVLESVALIWNSTRMLELAQLRPVEGAVQVRQRVAPDDDVDADRRAVAEDRVELLAGRRLAFSARAGRSRSRPRPCAGRGSGAGRRRTGTAASGRPIRPSAGGRSRRRARRAPRASPIAAARPRPAASRRTSAR